METTAFHTDLAHPGGLRLRALVGLASRLLSRRAWFLFLGVGHFRWAMREITYMGAAAVAELARIEYPEHEQVIDVLRADRADGTQHWEVQIQMPLSYICLTLTREQLTHLAFELAVAAGCKIVDAEP